MSRDVLVCALSQIKFNLSCLLIIITYFETMKSSYFLLPSLRNVYSCCLHIIWKCWGQLIEWTKFAWWISHGNMVMNNYYFENTNSRNNYLRYISSIIIERRLKLGKDLELLIIIISLQQFEDVLPGPYEEMLIKNWNMLNEKRKREKRLPKPKIVFQWYDLTWELLKMLSINWLEHIECMNAIHPTTSSIVFGVNVVVQFWLIFWFSWNQFGILS